VSAPLFLLSLLLGLLAPARASDALEAAREAELDRARAEVAGEIQLYAYDLVDELVYGWVQEPVFESPTPVILAGVTVPVGLGTGLKALLENHIAGVLTANPDSHVELVHCPACTAVVVHSGPEGTVISRGVDDPAALEKLGSETGRHALFIDVEAEGAWLVLRARITRLTPELPIVWSHTIASSTSSAALLRQPHDLKSAAEARAEYVDALHDRGPITIPLRFTIRSYAQPEGFATGIAPPPFLWLQTGVEMGSTGARAWTTSLIMGYSFIPQAYQGVMGQARISRLVNRRVRSLTRPNLYIFAGAAAISVWGPATAPFQDRALTSDDILAADEGKGPRTAFGAYHYGFDLRVGNRVGFGGFLEALPALRGSANLGEYVRFAGVIYQPIGTEVTFCF